MASTDAKPVPQKNVAMRITFPILDADGDLVTGATGLDSEVSKDGGTFADCTNEATEIATSSGIYYLDLTNTEMNADTVAVIVKTSSSGAKTTTIIMYPEEAGDIRVNVTQIEGADATDQIRDSIVDDATRIDASALNTATGTTIPAILDDTDLIDDGTSGLAKIATDVAAILADTADMQSKLGTPTDLGGGATLAANNADMAGATFDTSTDSQEAIRNRGDAAWTTATGFSTHSASDVWAAGTRTLTAIDEDSTTLDLDATIQAAVGLASANLDTQLAALPTAAENADAVWDEDATGHQTGGTFGQAIGDPGANTETIYDAVVTDAAGTNVAADIIAIKSETAAIVADTNELQTDWADGGRLDLILDARASQSSVDDIPTNAELATALSGLNDPTAAAIADAVWEEAIADHSGTAGSTAEQLAAAGAAGDPWATALPGAYSSGTAGKIVGDNINATISSRASQTSVDDLPTNAELATALGGLNDLSAAEVNAEVDTALADYDAPTKAELDSAVSPLATSADLATVDGNVDAIKAKTDSLTFTVTNTVNANITYVNEVEVTGDGQSGTEWGPA